MNDYFKKGETNWHCLTFYTILMDNGIKKIKLRAITSREYIDAKLYADFCYSYYPDNFCISLEEVLEWGDINYGLHTLLIKDFDIYNEMAIATPQECLDEANELYNGYFKKGSKKLNLFEITLDTECGDYYY